MSADLHRGCCQKWSRRLKGPSVVGRGRCCEVRNFHFATMPSYSQVVRSYVIAFGLCNVLCIRRNMPPRLLRHRHFGSIWGSSFRLCVCTQESMLHIFCDLFTLLVSTLRPCACAWRTESFTLTFLLIFLILLLICNFNII